VDALTIDDLHVRYGDTVALDGVSLAVAPSEVVAVLGPSGSGKSTLLRAVAGLEDPSSGSIRRDGADLRGVPPHRRGVGLMFQDHALFPHRDVLGNVQFGLRMQHVPRTEAAERAAAALAMVGLAGYEHRGVRELSGGEQQRVALARALAPEPSVLMLDEPLGALDRELREHLADDLAALFDRLDLAVLYVTHDHDEAFALGDRVAVMDAGRIEQVGPATEVWRRPATARAARFLGWNVRTSGGQTVAVRPESLRVVADATTDGVWTGTVVSHTFRRDHFRLRVHLTDGAEVEVAVAEPTPGVGTSVTLVPVEGTAVVLGT
jgi:thiamine transport system ATP-binding protein